MVFLKIIHKMKKIFLLLIVITFTSCSFPSYIFEDNNSNLGINFQNGKWLLGEVNGVYETDETIKKMILEDFTKKTPQRIFYIHDVKGIIIPKKVSINPIKLELKDLKKGTGFDFFINVKSEVVKNNLNDIDLTNHNFHYDQGKTVNCNFEIYDLNTEQIIYSKKVVGSVKVQDNNKSDINFSKSISKLTIGCLKKILKDIDRKSIY